MSKPSFLIFFFILSILINSLKSEPHFKNIEDGYLTSMELIKKYGYKGEEHNITTSDGYILTAHRILPNMNVCTDNDTKKPPVMLQHCITCSSGTYVVGGPKNGLGFLLSDNCYDVWMVNSRGSKYSQTHVYKATASTDYWDFTWHEMGIYDNPAGIDYILNATGAKKLLYIGHSQGATSFLIMNSLMPEYAQEKILAAMALSPIVYLEHTRSSLLRLFGILPKRFPFLLDLIEFTEFPPYRDHFKEILRFVCGDEFLDKKSFCENLVWFIAGNDTAQHNSTSLSNIMGHFFEGTSIKQLFHLAQSIRNRGFRPYDYGMSGNLEQYKTLTPPDYPLEKANCSIALWHYSDDYMNTPEDYELLVSRLPNVIGEYLVTLQDFDQSDPLLRKDTKTLLYEGIIRNISQFH